MPKKSFRIRAADIKSLVEDAGGCVASDLITVDGQKVGYMYREPPTFNADSGWRFLSGSESVEYADDADNHEVYEVNTIANYDVEIIPFLHEPVGSAFARDPETGSFERVASPVDPDERLHPDFPVTTGHYELDPTWNVFLPLKFSRRIEEDGSLILWRPGVTICIAAWDSDDDESAEIRLTRLKADISPDAFEPKDETNGRVKLFSYRLVEDGQKALYGFAVADSGHLQVAIYFDDEADIRVARSVISSLSET
jgi:hypothetical protein